MSAEFAPIDGMLYSTERQARIGSDHAVDEDESCFELVDQIFWGWNLCEFFEGNQFSGFAVIL